MNQGQFSKPPRDGVFGPGISQGLEIPPLTNRDLFSKTGALDKMRRGLNALLRLAITPPTAGRVLMSESGALIDLSTIAGGGGGGSGSNYRGLYDAGTALYSYGDLVYTGASLAARYFYVCEIANGLSIGAGAQTPDPTEAASPLYWRIAAQPPSMAVQELSFSAWGFGGNNDYITCSGQQVRLPPLLRFSLSSRTIFGVTISYSSYSTTNQSRIATVGANSITQVVTPGYASGDKVYVVNVAGVLQDLNVEGRTFAGPST